MDVQATRKWALSHPRIKGEDRRLLLAALDSFETLVGAVKVSPEELTAIIEAARCRWVAAGGVGGHALADLACQHPAAQEAFREMMASRKSSDRFRAVDSLSAGMPTALVQDVLARGLRDRSKGVRLCAARKCDTLRLRGMLPELERRAEAEPDPEVKRQFEFHAAMIRDGYLVEREEGGAIYLCVRARNGWSSQEISQDDIDNGLVPGLVAQRQAKPY
jgi:hypothetical protein